MRRSVEEAKLGGGGGLGGGRTLFYGGSYSIFFRPKGGANFKGGDI